MMDNEKVCPACDINLLEAQASKTWLRQIKIYTVSIVLGIVMLALTIPRLMHRAADTSPDQGLVAIAIAGGLATMGGLFGLAVAGFFYYIWKKKSAPAEDRA